MQLRLIAAASVGICALLHAAGSATQSAPASRPADAAEVGRVLRDARPGDVVRLPESIGELAEIPRVPLTLRVAEDSPQLLLSDDPEYFRGGDGIALQEDVKPGRVRLYVYHVPASGTEPRTITAVIENRGTAPMRLRMLRYAFPKPGKDYHRIGRAGLVDYFNSRPQPEAEARTVPPQGRIPVDPAMDRATAGNDELVHGLYEFEIDQPARISVLQRDPAQDSAEAVDHLPKPPPPPPGEHEPSGAGRGLFPGSNIDVTLQKGFALDPRGGPVQLVVADGQSDPWVTGRDGITGKPSRNQGNYGVMYRMRLRLPRRLEAGEAIALLMAHNFRQSKWCGHVAAAVQVNGRTVALPSSKYTFGAFPEAVLIEVLTPETTGGREDIEILYSPPGASCLPNPILLVPVTREK